MMLKKLFVITIACCLLSLTANAETIVSVPRQGSLSEQLSSTQRDTCTSLTVIGTLNSTDIIFLRGMAGADNSEGNPGKLRILDLRKATFQDDKTPYLILDMSKEKMQGHSIPHGLTSGAPWTSFSSYEVHSDYGGTRTVSNSESVAYRDIEYTINTTYTNVPDGSIRIESYPSHLYADFSKPFTKEERTRLRKFDMFKVKAHKIKWEKDHYVWYAYLRKGLFCYDMFYGCKTLEAIALPEGIKTMESVHEMNDSKRYYTSKGIH